MDEKAKSLSRHDRDVVEDAFRGAWAIWRMTDTFQMERAVTPEAHERLSRIGCEMSALMGDMKRGAFWKTEGNQS